MPLAVFVRASCREIENSQVEPNLFGWCIDEISAAAPIDAIQDPLQSVLTSMKHDAAYFHVYINDELPPKDQGIPATVISWSTYVNHQIQVIQSSSTYNAAPPKTPEKQSVQNGM